MIIKWFTLKESPQACRVCKASAMTLACFMLGKSNSSRHTMDFSPKKYRQMLKINPQSVLIYLRHMCRTLFVRD